MYRKILNSDERDFENLVKTKKWYVLEEIVWLISGSLPEDQGGLTCILLWHGTITSGVQLSIHPQG